MRRARYVLLGTLVAAGIAVVVIAALGGHPRSSTARSLQRGQLLAVSGKIAPQSVLFGDPVQVQVDAVVDRRRLDPNRFHLDANWTPYQPVAPLVRTRTDVGPYTRLRWTVDLQCLVSDCVPQPGASTRHVFEPTTVRYVGLAKETSPSSLTIAWPQVSAVSRLDPSEMQKRAVPCSGSPRAPRCVQFLPPWHVNSGDLDPVSYAVTPNSVFWGALVLALMLVLAAGLVLRPYLPGVSWLPRRAAARSPLERALEAVERVRGGETAEERKALELLAAELRKAGSGRLAWTATVLAWSPSEPEPARTVELTESVRLELEERTNGRRA